jgi:hypothetical protein
MEPEYPAPASTVSGGSTMSYVPSSPSVSSLIDFAASMQRENNALHSMVQAFFNGAITRAELAAHAGVVDRSADVASATDASVASDGSSEGGDMESSSSEEANSDDEAAIDDSDLSSQGHSGDSYAPSESGDSHASSSVVG